MVQNVWRLKGSGLKLHWSNISVCKLIWLWKGVFFLSWESANFLYGYNLLNHTAGVPDKLAGFYGCMCPFLWLHLLKRIESFPLTGIVPDLSQTLLKDGSPDNDSHKTSQHDHHLEHVCPDDCFKATLVGGSQQKQQYRKQTLLSHIQPALTSSTSKWLDVHHNRVSQKDSK